MKNIEYKETIENGKRVIEFPPYYGEFGWEICSVIPLYRKMSKNYDKIKCSSFNEMKYLYEDFSEFSGHDIFSRRLTFEPKIYKTNGTFKKYGILNKKYDILIHARGLHKKIAINYLRWNEVVKELKDFSVACIGTLQDQKIDGISDERHINLELLCNYLAGAKVCVGQSSGVLHLASHCGCNQVVWSDYKTRNGVTLKQRYEKDWNPFNTKVEYIFDDKWSPNPEEIINRIRKFV